jgi:hypothetical protein
VYLPDPVETLRIINMDDDDADETEVVPHQALLNESQHCLIQNLAMNCEKDNHHCTHHDSDYDAVNNNDEGKSDAIINRTEDVSETQVHASGGRRTNQPLRYRHTATAAANSTARVMRLRGSYHDQNLNSHAAREDTNIPRLDEFSDDSFEYPETAGDHHSYDDDDYQELDNARGNDLTPLSSSDLIVTNKNNYNYKWTDEDYPAITWITPSGDSVVETLIRRSQRMALLILAATIFAAMLSTWTLRHSDKTPPFRSTNNVSPIAEMNQILAEVSDVSTLSAKQSKGENVTPPIVPSFVDTCRKNTINEASREKLLSVWQATKSVFSTSVRHPSDDQHSLSIVELPLQAVQDTMKHTEINKRVSVALVYSAPSAHNPKEANQLVSLDDMRTLRWGILPAMPARYSFSSLEPNGLVDPRSAATCVSQMTSHTKSGPSIFSLPLPSEVDTLPLENQRKMPPILRRLILLFDNDRSTGKSHQGVMETMQLPRSLSGTIPQYVAQLSSLQLSSLQMQHDAVPRPTTISTTTTVTVSLLDLVAARILVAQKGISEWLSSDRYSTTQTTRSTTRVVNSRIEFGNSGLWGTIPSNLGHSSVLVGMLYHHFTTVDELFQESQREQPRKEASPAGEKESSIQSSKLGNDHVWQDLALIQTWMTPTSGLSGTISRIGPSAIQIGMYLQI